MKGMQQGRAAGRRLVGEAIQALRELAREVRERLRVPTRRVPLCWPTLRDLACDPERAWDQIEVMYAGGAPYRERRGSAAWCEEACADAWRGQQAEATRRAMAAQVDRIQAQQGGEGRPGEHRPDAIERARLLLAGCNPSIQGSNGSGALFNAAAVLVRGFALSPAAALALLESDFNPRCQPPWRRDELARAVRNAEKRSTMEHGCLLNAPRRVA